jgi:hypothetical protein
MFSRSPRARVLLATAVAFAALTTGCGPLPLLVAAAVVVAGGAGGSHSGGGGGAGASPQPEPGPPWIPSPPSIPSPPWIPSPPPPPSSPPSPTPGPSPSAPPPPSSPPSPTPSPPSLPDHLVFAVQPSDTVAGFALPTTGLYRYYKLDETSGTVAHDSSGNGVDGTLVNGPTWTTGIVGGGLSFNGVDQYVNAGTIPALALSDSFTWAFWANLRTTAGDLIGNRTGGAGGVGAFIKFTQQNFQFWTNGTTPYVNYTVPLGAWYHLCVVKNGPSLTYYSDGQVVATGTAEADMGWNPFYLGGDIFWGPEMADETLDEVRLYTRALSATEVGILANQPYISAGTISPAVEVDIVGTNGLVDTTANGTVTIALGSGTGTLGGTLTVTATNGVALFSNLSIAKAGSGYTLTATASGVTGSATSNTFQVLPGTPAQLAFVTSPATTVTTGIPLAPAVVVSVLDSAGNPVADGTSVSMALGANPAGATLSGTLAATTTGGLAAFSNLLVVGDGAGLVLVASASTLASATSPAFSASGPAASLVFSVQPVGAIQNAALTPAVQVTALDSQGNVAATTSTAISIALGSSPSGANLSGTTSVVPSSGVATFAGLALDTIGTGYTLVATYASIQATSAPFVVTGVPAHVVFTTQPSNVAPGVAPATNGLYRYYKLDETSGTVAHDSSGNGVDGTLINGPAWTTGILGGGLSFNGVDQYVSAGTIPALAVGDSFSWAFWVYLYAQTANPIIGNQSDDTAGDYTNFTKVCGSSFQFYINHTYNPEINFNVPTLRWAHIAVVKNGSQFTYYCNGVAVGTGTTTAAMPSNTFYLGGDPYWGGGIYSNDVLDEVRLYTRALTPAEVAVLATPSPSSTMSPAVTVTILDALGNVVVAPGQTVTVALGNNPGSATLTGTLLQPAVNGVATFSDLEVDQVGTGYTLLATSGSLSATSGSFSVIAPATLPVATGALTFAIASASTQAVYELTLGSSFTPATQTGSLAGTNPAGLVAQSGDMLTTLDGTSGNVVTYSRSLGQVAAVTSLDVAPTFSVGGFARTIKGENFGIFPGQNLRRVDPSTGLTFPQWNSTGVTVVAVAADAWGTFYLGGSSGSGSATTLYTFDIVTDTLTTVGAFGVGIDVLTAGSDGQLYGLNTSQGATAQLYRIQPTTGAATFVGDTGVPDATGFVEVPGYTTGGAGAPWVRACVPDTLVSGTTTEVVLEGENLAGATITPGTSGVTVVADRVDAAGDLRVISLELSPGALTSPATFLVANAHGTTRFGIPVLDGTAPLVVASTDVLHLAGAFQVPSLTIEFGGVLVGVGLRPLLVFSDGDVTIGGSLDVSGHLGGIPMGSGATSPPYTYKCGDGGDGGPGGGGGGGGGAAQRAAVTQGGNGGWGYSGGGGGGGSPGGYLSGRGGLGAGGFGGDAALGGSDFSSGGNGGLTPGGAPGGAGAQGGAGGGTGSDTGQGGPPGLEGTATVNGAQSSSTGLGGGGGAQQSSNGTGGGGASFGVAGEAGRLSQGSTSGGGAVGLVYGNANLVPLVGGSGGGGGSGRGAFNGLAGGGGGGGGALVLASRTTITVTATGAILGNGGQGSCTLNADGEGGGGSGGALLLETPSLSLASGGTIAATGAPIAPRGSSNQYQGAGGDGRIRVDAPTLTLAGSSTTETSFMSATSPAVGFFGSSVPSVSVSAPASGTGTVVVPFNVSDSNSSFVWVDVQCSVDGGAFVPATAAAGSAPLFALSSSPGGTAYVFNWSSAADAGTGTHSVVLQLRAVDAYVGAWTATSAISVSN